MNPLLARLHPYPFERWRALTHGITPNPALRPISLGIGEPRPATPALVEEALRQGIGMLSTYPATAGEPRLREACAGWVRSCWVTECRPRSTFTSWASVRPGRATRFMVRV